MTREQHNEMIVLPDCAFRRGDVRTIQYSPYPQGEECVSITLAIKGCGQKVVYTKESYAVVLAALGLGQDDRSRGGP